MDHFLCMRHIFWLHSIITITVGRIFKLCHPVLWRTTQLWGRLLKSTNGNLDPNNFKEFGTVFLYVFENLPIGSLPNRIQVQASPEPLWKSICLYNSNSEWWLCVSGNESHNNAVFIYRERQRVFYRVVFLHSLKKNHDLCWSEESLHNYHALKKQNRAR